LHPNQAYQGLSLLVSSLVYYSKNNYMKLTFTALAVFTAILVRAQFDLSIAITSPTEDYEFDSGATVEVDLDITNWGDIIPEFDTLYLGWVLDGTFYGPNPGALVKETKLVGTQAVDVLDLNPGLYLARIENSTGEVLLNSKIKVSR
jgi:hypothetical protein